SLVERRHEPETEEDAAARTQAPERVDQPVSDVTRLGDLVSSLIGSARSIEAASGAPASVREEAARIRRAAERSARLAERLRTSLASLARDRRLEEEDLSNRLRELSRTDALTGLPNVDTFNDRAAQALSQAPFTGQT